MEVSRNMVLGTLTMHQHTYIQSMVTRYACTDECDALLLLPPSVHFTKQGAQMKEYPPEGNLYRSISCRITESLVAVC